jgi:sec-independent protein translocase protein TatA
MFGLGMGELLIILVIVMLIFGVGKLPEIGSGLGKAIGNFKKAAKEQESIDITPKKEEEKQIPDKKT